jgi:hypothetical protein
LEGLAMSPWWEVRHRLSLRCRVGMGLEVGWYAREMLGLRKTRSIDDTRIPSRTASDGTAPRDLRSCSPVESSQCQCSVYFQPMPTPSADGVWCVAGPPTTRMNGPKRLNSRRSSRGPELGLTSPLVSCLSSGLTEPPTTSVKTARQDVPRLLPLRLNLR